MNLKGPRSVPETPGGCRQLTLRAARKLVYSSRSIEASVGEPLIGVSGARPSL